MKKIILAVAIIVGAVSFSLKALEPPHAYLQYFGQACFVLTAPGGVRIVMDPHGKMDYPLPEENADIVTVSHEHFDHNNVKAIKGDPVVIRGLKPDGDWNEVDETIKGVHIRTVGTYHDDEKGAKRGKNAVFIFEFMDLKVVHLGDLGHLLDEETAKKIGKPDALMIPVGGHFTIGPAEAWKVVGELDPSIVFPMHYQTAKTRDLPIQPLDSFLSGVKNVKWIKSSITGIVPPEKQEVWVLQIPK